MPRGRVCVIATVLLAWLVVGPTTPAGALGSIQVVTHPDMPSFAPSWANNAQDQAGPDPDVVRFGTSYYAYTTGTTWGNHIGVLRSSAPASGYETITGKPYGSSAFPSVPWNQTVRPWQVNSTQNAPGVFRYDGRYIMYYTAQAASGHDGHYCLSRATARNPAGPFVDRSNGPWMCMDGAGGVIDPSPYVDAHGQAWLYVKTYDLVERGPEPARIWVMRLSRDGLNRVSSPVPVLSQSSMSSPYETVENPQMLQVGNTYLLLFSRGSWNSSNYRQGYAICSGPAGGCHETDDGFLRSYGSVLGPGGGTMFTDPRGHLYIAYDGWHGASSCTGDSASCARMLFVARVNFS
ncbi:MAG: family 43 glycosylhydrolase [Acidimicrobiia bacterium]